jgi:hypothetical protein
MNIKKMIKRGIIPDPDPAVVVPPTPKAEKKETPKKKGIFSKKDK